MSKENRLSNIKQLWQQKMYFDGPNSYFLFENKGDSSTFGFL